MGKIEEGSALAEARKIIANEFLEAKARLSPSDSSRTDKTVLKILSNPDSPGLNIERLRGALDPDLCSARVNDDIRIIFCRRREETVFLYVDHHEKAYRWAERRRVRAHPVTGEFQIVNIPTVDLAAAPSESIAKESIRLKPKDLEKEQRRRLEGLSDADMLEIGVPTELLDAIREAMTEEQFLNVFDSLPDGVADRVWQVIVEGEPIESFKIKIAANLPAAVDSRQFYRVDPEDDLEYLLSKPYEEWLLFLHPQQQRLAEIESDGPVLVRGGPGTGKTVLAVHRARYLARKGERVLLTTYSRALAHDLKKRLKLLCRDEELALIECGTVDSVVKKVMDAHGIRLRPVDDPGFRAFIDSTLGKFTEEFYSEWDDVIRPYKICTREEYLDFDRNGVALPLMKAEREGFWKVYSEFIEWVESRNMLPWHMYAKKAAELLQRSEAKPFSAVVADEVQDFSRAQIEFLMNAASGNGNALMLLGDMGQRIYPGQNQALEGIGLDISKRTYELTVNYRTGYAILAFVQPLQEKVQRDFHGETCCPRRQLPRGKSEAPILRGFGSYVEENLFVKEEIAGLLGSGVRPNEIAVFARREKDYYYFERALAEAGISVSRLGNDKNGDDEDSISFGTLHSAKGLEFDYVFFVAFRANVLPASWELKKCKDSAAKERIEKREKKLAFVTMTRARKRLYVTWTRSPSGFLRVLEGEDYC